MSDIEHLSHKDFRCHFLDRIKLLIENLPWQLPVKTEVESVFATFLAFRINPDLLELTGCEVSALSEQLKRVFGWNARDGIVSITERGNGRVFAPLACIRSLRIFGSVIRRTVSFVNEYLMSWRGLKIQCLWQLQRLHALWSQPTQRTILLLLKHLRIGST